MTRGEVVAFPKRTRVGSLLCWLGRHKWSTPVAASVVIPTGSALLIKSRVESVRCVRLGCTAQQRASYKRAAS